MVLFVFREGDKPVTVSVASGPFSVPRNSAGVQAVAFRGFSRFPRLGQTTR